VFQSLSISTYDRPDPLQHGTSALLQDKRTTGMFISNDSANVIHRARLKGHANHHHGQPAAGWDPATVSLDRQAIRIVPYFVARPVS